MIVLSKYFLLLIIYSFVGWVYESTLCSIKAHKLINRGFLNGPVCPVYGFGALAVIFVLSKRADNIFVLFFAGMLLTCVIEYFTAYLLEKAFDTKWWDYSRFRFNLHGRICLMAALVFGAFAVVLIRYIHPVVMGLVNSLSYQVLVTSSMIVFILVSTDLLITVHHLLKFNGRLKEIQEAINLFMSHPIKYAEEVKESLLERFESSEYFSEHIKELLLLKRFQEIRIIHAFPRMSSVKYNDALQKIKSKILAHL